MTTLNPHRPKLKGEKPREAWAIGDYAVFQYTAVWPYVAVAQIAGLVKSPNGGFVVDGYPEPVHPFAVIDADHADHFLVSLGRAGSTFRTINRTADQLIQEAEDAFMKAVTDA